MALTRASIGMALGAIAAMLGAFAAIAPVYDDSTRLIVAVAAAFAAGSAYLHGQGGDASPSPASP